MNLILEFLCVAISLYLLVLFARAILSWFPVESGSAMASVNRVLEQLTDPLLVPLRRVVPRAGMFDLSYLVLFIGLMILRTVLCGSGI